MISGDFVLGLAQEGLCLGVSQARVTKQLYDTCALRNDLALGGAGSRRLLRIEIMNDKRRMNDLRYDRTM